MSELLPPPQAGDPYLKGMVLNNPMARRDPAEHATVSFVLEDDGNLMSPANIAQKEQEIQAVYQANRATDQAFQDPNADIQWAPEPGPEQPRFGLQFSARSEKEIQELKQGLWGSDWQGAEAPVPARGIKQVTDADKAVMWGENWRRKDNKPTPMATLPEDVYSSRANAESSNGRRSILGRVKNAITLLPAKLRYQERLEGPMSRRRKAAMALGTVGLIAAGATQPGQAFAADALEFSRSVSSKL